VARDLPVPRRDLFGRLPNGRFPLGRGQAGENARQGPMANPFEFIQQVRAEASKVTWPTRRETLITTGLVILMVIVASIFFIAVDQSIRIVLGYIMALGR
jgi:preprotein translocase subunit SecE